MSVAIPANSDNVAVVLKALRNGSPFPLPADTVVQSSDSTKATVGFDLASGLVTVTRVGFAASTVVITALGGGLTAQMEVNIAEAVATELVFDESTAVNS